jgi:spore germination protein YaaH
MHMQYRSAGLLVVVTLFAFAPQAHAASFEVSGWIPYWRSATGTADALQHLDAFTEINPFVYTIKKDGTLVDNGKLQEEPWASFIATAKAKKIRIIPTVMSSDKEFLSATLKNAKKRQALEDAIAAEVKAKGYDGIDIDFENKGASTRTYFALFLKGLYQRMGTKWVTCTIEARTPPADLYKTIPADLEYANDFAAINKYCDRVRFMTYDQRDAVYTLNEANKSVLNAPIADPKWVEKAIRLAMKQIKPSKIQIGIATYGYEYRVGGAVGDYTYKILWSFNPRYASQIAQLYGMTPTRNSAGEMGLAYVPTSTQMLIGTDTFAADPVGEDTGVSVPTGGIPTSADENTLQTAFRYLVWSDAQAIKDKVDLAKRLGIRGVAIFKIDGGEDLAMWPILSAARR